MTCQTCVYWKQLDSPGIGACRRYPPQLALTQGTLLVTAQWPLTGEAEWCGEHIEQEDTASMNFQTLVREALNNTTETKSYHPDSDDRVEDAPTEHE